jgi:uncharacterized protein YjiS (DUF1127 family)
MSIINLLSGARRAFSEWRLSEQAYGDLLALNDHLLADIGLHRSQLPLVGALNGNGQHPVSHQQVCSKEAPEASGSRKSDRLYALAPLQNSLGLEPARSRPVASRTTLQRRGVVILVLVAAGTMAVAGAATAAQIGVAARRAISPTQPFSSPANSPLQQQMQQDYRTNLLGARRDLLQTNPSGLGHQQIEIQHQLDTLPP